MAPNSLFGRGDDRDDDHTTPEPSGPPKEGVRVLGAEEVAEVAERAETARRRGPDEKKFGDRPEAPPADVKPAMRFPLAGSDDPNRLDRPRPAPVQPSAGEPEPEVDLAQELAGEPVLEKSPGQAPEQAPPGSSEPAPEVSSSGPRTGPVLSVGAPTGETQLPHWTEAATGEVPRVVIGDDADDDEDDSKWAAFAASSPRWRDENTDWSREQDTGFDDLGSPTANARLGALDERERMLDEQYLTFDDLQVPDAAPPQAVVRPTADLAPGPAPDPSREVAREAAREAPREVTRDPIRIQGSARRPTGGVPVVGPPVATGADRLGAADRGAPRPARTASESRDRDQAIRVGVGIAVGALIVFLIGAQLPWVPLLLVVAAIVACTAELLNATTKAGFRPITPLALAAGVALPLAAYFGGRPTVPEGESAMLAVVVVTIAASLGWYLFGAGRGRPVANIAITLMAVLYVGVLGSYGALLLRAGPWPGSGTTANQGVSFFILVALGTTIYDAAGYLLGSRFGHTPLSAASPNKTREGLLAGMGASFFVVLVVGGLFKLGVKGVGDAFVLGVVIAVVAPLGDLFESLIKRDLGVKDMGTIIPSHGGILDRVDAYLFTLPAAYYALRLLGLL
jgi:phosphatidate cytidylyltransferase